MVGTFAYPDLDQIKRQTSLNASVKVCTSDYACACACTCACNWDLVLISER